MKQIKLNESSLRRVVENIIRETLENTKTNLQVFKEGIVEIAENHGFQSDISNLETEGNVCIYTTEKEINIPTIADVKQLCQEVGIPENMVDVSDFGIDVNIPYDWYMNQGNELYTGEGLWGKYKGSIQEDDLFGMYDGEYDGPTNEPYDQNDVRETPSGIQFEVLNASSLDSFEGYDRVVASNQIKNCGKIIVDPSFGDPIDNEYELEEIYKLLK